MLKLEQIKPYTLLLDARTATLTRVLKVEPLRGDCVPIIGADEQGHFSKKVLRRADEEYFRTLENYPHMQRDPAAVLGCLLGGAVGDALGAPVEFLDWSQIRREFGKQGIADFVPVYGQLGAITDDTQMMLFTAEGLLRAYVRSTTKGICLPHSVIHHALLRWLLTQGIKTNSEPDERGMVVEVGTDGWLFHDRRLWSRRAPGNTCISALSASNAFGHFAENNSKGCGAVMRVAPCAFLGDAFESAAKSSQLTHGHPTGYLAAGLFADMLARVWQTQMPLADAVRESLVEYGRQEGMAETLQIVTTVLGFAQEGVIPTPAGIEALGGGWVAEEALAIGLWCALTTDSFEEGVMRAVNHSGDSDSTGLIAGHFLGLIHAVSAIPSRWLDNLELRDVIEQVANDISYVPFAFNEDDPSPVSDGIWEPEFNT